jgi:hypothetical protein
MVFSRRPPLDAHFCNNPRLVASFFSPSKETKKGTQGETNLVTFFRIHVIRGNHKKLFPEKNVYREIFCTK